MHQRTVLNAPTTPLEVSSVSTRQLATLVQTQALTIETLQQQVDGLKHQIEWFKRQLFGQKSERFAPEPNPNQLALGAVLAPAEPCTEPRQSVPAHTRRVAQRDAAANDAESLPFFDESRVPVETVEVFEPEVADLSADQYEVIGQKVSYRLAQRPGNYMVIKYVRPVIKRLDTQAIHCAHMSSSGSLGRS